MEKTITEINDEIIENALKNSPYFMDENTEDSHVYYDQERHIMPYEWMHSIDRLLYVSIKPFRRKQYVRSIKICHNFIDITMSVETLDDIINALTLAKLYDVANSLKAKSGE